MKFDRIGGVGSTGTCVIGLRCASCRLTDMSCRPIGANRGLDLSLTDLADSCYMITQTAGPQGKGLGLSNDLERHRRPAYVK